MQAWTGTPIFGLWILKYSYEAAVLCSILEEESFSLNYCAVS